MSIEKQASLLPELDKHVMPLLDLARRLPTGSMPNSMTPGLYLQLEHYIEMAVADTKLSAYTSKNVKNILYQWGVVDNHSKQLAWLIALQCFIEYHHNDGQIGPSG